MKAGRSFALGHERENVWKLLKLGKLSLSILYVAGMFINELKTKLNVFFFFLRMVSKNLLNKGPRKGK